VQSPNGWIDPSDSVTSGNNVAARLPAAAPIAGSSFRVFDFPLDLGQVPSASQGASVTQVFYDVNWIHDRLYQLGFASWLPSSAIGDGVYYGMRVGGRLVAAAGTHVISRQARLAVVGNVLTHVDYRGRGYATAVTGAVTADLLRSCDQVVLNVRSDNPPALQAYRRLGYAEHVRFEERLAHRLGSPWPDLTAPLRRLFSRRETDRR